jgi:hypothetical protein
MSGFSGARACDALDDQYGRRVEADRSWTVYHVFTGVPARFEGSAMTGLTCPAATSGMLSLNSRSVARRTERHRSRSTSRVAASTVTRLA